MPPNKVDRIASSVAALIFSLEESGRLAAELGEAPPLASVSVELFNHATDIRQALGEKLERKGAIT